MNRNSRSFRILSNVILQNVENDAVEHGMNSNSRRFKILNNVRPQNKENNTVAEVPSQDHDVSKQPQYHTKREVSEQPQDYTEHDVINQPQETELSIAIQNLQEEYIQAQGALSESMDTNLFDTAFTKTTGLNDIENTEALIDLVNLNNAIIIEEQDVDLVDSTLERGNRDESQGEITESESTSQKVVAEKENRECKETEFSVEKEENFDPENKKRKRLKNRLSDSRNWLYNSNKKKREQGVSYVGRKNNKFVVTRNKKILKVRCSCSENHLKAKRSFACFKISEEERQKIFDKFWKLSWEEKKVYCIGRAVAISVARARNRKNDEESRRTVSYVFFMDKKNERVRVCKTMFCNTLGIPMRTLTRWLNTNLNSPPNKKENVENLDTERQNLGEKAKRAIETKSSVTEFLNCLPKLESHYCRKTSTKLYLEPRWKSKTELYALYKDSWCNEKQIKEGSLTMFKYIFDEMNLSLFRPKKDECDICVGYRTNNISEEVYQEHIIKKNEARGEKEADKESSNKVFTMDLESVLLCPQSNASALYYKKKLIVHNFTVFDLHSKDGYCFVWHEGEGELKAHCFASIICNFLAKQFLPNTDPENRPSIILYSDGCAAQNRNSILSNALLNFAIQNNIVVIQKYLEKGHSQMECDSMHSTIERSIARRDINVPADYVHYMKIARKQPRPYEVQYLHHNYFKDFSKINFVTSIRPGHKLGDPTVQNIRALKYNPEGTIEYKLRHSDDFKLLPVRVNKKTSIPLEHLPRLYRTKLKIKQDKFEHLQSLKGTLEQDYHHFYDCLGHE